MNICLMLYGIIVDLFKSRETLKQEKAALRRLVRWKQIQLEREDPEKAREVADFFSGVKCPDKKKMKNQKQKKQG